MKLSYVYTVTADGAGSKTVEANVATDSPWRRLVDDNRTLWKQFHVHGRNLALTIAPGGLLLAVAKMGGSRDGDNVTVWVYLPGQAAASGTDLTQTAQRLLQLLESLGTSEVNEDTFLSDPILNREYPERKRAVPKTFGSRYGKLAYRKLDTFEPNSPLPTMEDVLDSPFQRLYAPYQFIFLLGEPGSNPDTRNAEDLSATPLERLLTVTSPQLPWALAGGMVEIEAQPGKWVEFTEPVQASPRDRLRLRISKQGCRPVEVTASPGDGNGPAKLPTEAHSLKWMKDIPPRPVRVFDEEGKELKGFRLKFDVGGVFRDVCQIPEAQFTNARVRVFKEGFAVAKETVNLEKAATEPCRITLKKDLTGARGKDGYASGSSRHDDFFGKPEPRRGHSAGIWAAVGVGAILLVGAGVGCWFWFGGNDIAGDKADQKKEYYAGDTDIRGGEAHRGQEAGQTGGSQANDPNYNLEAAVRYLDSNKVWDRKVMDQYPDLVGLYTMLNNFELETFEQRYGPTSKFAGSRQLKYLLEHVKPYVSRNRNGLVGKHAAGWNAPGSPEQIDVRKYANWINRQCEQAQGKGNVAPPPAPRPKPAPNPTPNPAPNPAPNPDPKGVIGGGID